MRRGDVGQYAIFASCSETPTTSFSVQRAAGAASAPPSPLFGRFLPMTLLNFTFQEASPLITYSSGWLEGDPNQDPLAADYNGSFRVTQTAQSSLSFTFLGTAVTLFGATRFNHGNYSVTLDLQPPFVASGFASNDEFNKSLWNADQLAYTRHTVTLTNIPINVNLTFFDLDFVSIERQIGQPGDTLHQLTLDNTSPFVSFVGPWDTATGISSAYQGTLHSTKNANAQVSFSFEGASLEIYGQYANAPYTVTLDNQPPVSLKGLDVDLTNSSQHPQTLLYLVDGLSDGNHTVMLMNSVSNENRPLFFDYAIIRGTSNPNVTSSPTTNSPAAGLNSTSTSGASNQSAISGHFSSNHKSQVAAIAGGIVGAFAAIAIIGIGVLLLIRRRRGLARDETREPFIDSEPNPYVIYNDVRSGGGSHEQRQTQDGPLLLAHPVANPPSKSHAALRTHPTNPSTSETSTTSASKAIAPSSQPGSTSLRGHNRSSSSRGRRGGSRGTTVQEEDAGAVIDPDEVATLPPAYNPTWSHNPPQGS